MIDTNLNSILMNQYKNQTKSFLPHPSSLSDVQGSIWSSQSMKITNHADRSSDLLKQLKTDAWVQEEQTSSTNEQRNIFQRLTTNICSTKCKAVLIGLLIGSLLAGIALATVSTIAFATKSTITTTTITTTITTETSTTETTTTTSVTTTTQAPAMAHSSLTSYCGCSGFTLSLTNIAFNTTNATYLWQSSPTGQNTWTNLNTPSSSPSFTVSSQAYSSDYQCIINVQYAVPMNLTSSIVTVSTTTNTTYCQTRATDCSCCGDDINNFILVGESVTQIYDLATNCSANGYDNRTQESVSLYLNTNYTAQASTQYTGGGERLSIWIDFNNNFQFESSEQVAYQILNITYMTNVQVVIPSSSQGGTIGIHRMRATLAYSATPNSCGTSSGYGETHDYTVNILSLPGR